MNLTHSCRLVRPPLEDLVKAPNPRRPRGMTDDEWFEAERPGWATWRDLRDTGYAPSMKPNDPWFHGVERGMSDISIEPEGRGMGDMPNEAIESYFKDLGVSSEHFNPQMAPARRTFKEIPGLTPQAWPTLPRTNDPKNSTDPQIQAFMSSDIGQKNIEKVLSMATPEERDYWTKWYPGAHAIAWRLAKKYNVSLAVAAGVLAVLSPQEDWVNNVALANAALAGDWPNVKTLDTSRQKAWTLINERDFSAIRGDKVHRFFMSIYSPEQFQDEVVVDTHAAAIWLGRRVSEIPSISPAVRAKMDADYKAAAAAMGMTPQGAQALSWVLWRGIETTESGRSTGKKSVKGLTEGVEETMGLSAGFRIRLASVLPKRAQVSKSQVRIAWADTLRDLEQIAARRLSNLAQLGLHKTTEDRVAFLWPEVLLEVKRFQLLTALEIVSEVKELIDNEAGALETNDFEYDAIEHLRSLMDLVRQAQAGAIE